MQADTPVKIAYVLLCHAHTSQLTRLVNHLTRAGGLVVIHCDKKTDQGEYDRMVDELASDQVMFCRRISLYWGGIGILLAQVIGLQELQRRKINCDYVMALTGADYPIKPSEYIQDFLRKRAGKGFMTHTPIPSPALDFLGDQGRDRIQYWHFRKPGRTRMDVQDHIVFPKMGCFGRFPFSTLWDMFVSCFPLKRHFMPGYISYYGGCYWTLSWPIVESVLSALEKNPFIMRSARTVLLPDEHVIQTIVLNSLHADKIENNDYRFVLWEQRETGGPPAFLDERDKESLRSTDCLFARKFCEQRNPGMLDWIDRELL